MSTKPQATQSFVTATEGKTPREIELEALLAARDATIAAQAQSLTASRTENEIHKDTIEELATLANVDALTRLTSRGKLDSDLSELINLNATFSIVIMDLNKFKDVNDTFGHGAGDDILKALANELRETFKGDAYTLGRTGGDEFTLLLRDMDAQEASRRLSLLNKHLPCKTSGQKFSVHFSFGAVDYDGQTASSLKEEADQKLYDFKATTAKKIPTTWEAWQTFDAAKVSPTIMHPAMTPSSQPA